MNGRVYDPFIARFMSPDPFTQDPGNLQGYNRYSYVLNNPMKYIDPSGYRTISMQEAIYYLLNSSEHGGTWTSTGGGGGEVNDFSNSDDAFVARAGYLNQHNAWGENGNNSPFKAYNAYYVSKGGKTNVKAISRNDYTLNNPGTDYFERHFDHFEINNSNKGKIDFFNSSAEERAYQIFNAMIRANSQEGFGYFKLEDIFYNIKWDHSSSYSNHGAKIICDAININGTNMSLLIDLASWTGNVRFSSSPAGDYPKTYIGFGDKYNWLYRFENVNKSGEMGLRVMSIYINDPVTYQQFLEGTEFYYDIFQNYLGF